MCIIIDTCCLALVFNSKTKGHDDFKPVRDWIVDGDGKMVYGGTKYKRELAKAHRYRRLVIEFKRAKLAIELDSLPVDNAEKQVTIKTCDTSFNDQHLVAIVIVSKCRLLCTCEKSALPFIKDASLYPRGVKRPKIYSGKQNTRLLTDRNIAGICRKL